MTVVPPKPSHPWKRRLAIDPKPAEPDWDTEVDKIIAVGRAVGLNVWQSLHPPAGQRAPAHYPERRFPARFWADAGQQRAYTDGWRDGKAGTVGASKGVYAMGADDAKGARP